MFFPGFRRRIWVDLFPIYNSMVVSSVLSFWKLFDLRYSVTTVRASLLILWASDQGLVSIYFDSRFISSWLILYFVKRICGFLIFFICSSRSNWFFGSFFYRTILMLVIDLRRSFERDDSCRSIPQIWRNRSRSLMNINKYWPIWFFVNIVSCFDGDAILCWGYWDVWRDFWG